MDIRNILNEEFDSLSRSELTSLQLRTLNRLNDGTVDLDSASDREADLIMELIDLGLVDDNGQLTDAGMAALSPEDTSSFRTSEVPDYDAEMGGDGFGDDELDFSVDTQ